MRKASVLIVSVFLMAAVTSCSMFGSQGKEAGVKKETSQVRGEQTPAAEKAKTIEDTNENKADLQGKKVKMKLYYTNSDNSAVPYEEREVEVRDGALIKAAVTALLESPLDKNLRKAIPQGTRVLEVNKKDSVAIINLSKEYNNFGGSAAEIVARASIINTLTEIQGIEKVKILIEGKDLIGPSGKPLGEMDRVALDAKGAPLQGEKRTLTLYFGNSQADKVAVEKRTVAAAKGESLEKLIFEELKKGPTIKGLHAVIPKEARLLSASTKNGICTLNLSREFVDKHTGGTAGESMTVNAIVNSLTELPEVKKVQFLIEGQKREVFLHLVFNEPFSRSDAMIER